MTVHKDSVLWDSDSNTFVVRVPGTEEDIIDITESVLTLMADAWKNGAGAVVMHVEYDNPYAVELDELKAGEVESTHDHVPDE